jgi:hypothetical protein
MYMGMVRDCTAGNTFQAKSLMNSKTGKDFLDRLANSRDTWTEQGLFRCFRYC